jgi:hypothetical protein
MFDSGAALSRGGLKHQLPSTRSAAVHFFLLAVQAEDFYTTHADDLVQSLVILGRRFYCTSLAEHGVTIHRPGNRKFHCSSRHFA